MRIGKALVIAAMAGMLTASAAYAQVVKKSPSSLQDLVATTPRDFVPPNVMQVEQMRLDATAVQSPVVAEVAGGWDRFVSQNGDQWSLTVDRRTGRISLAKGSGIPWIPGAGNGLQANASAVGSEPPVSAGRMIKLSKQFVRSYPELFGVDAADLKPVMQGTGQFADYLWYVQFQRTYHGIPVEKSNVVFRVNHGNLIQFGGEFLGAINLDPTPYITPETARQIAAGYVGDMGPGDSWVNAGSLSVLPLAPVGDVGVYTAAPGEGVDYHLVYTVAFQRQGVMGTWEAKIDAHTGEVLSFRDANEYGSIKGGIYVTSNLDTEVVRPMAFANSASGTYANAAGVYPQTSGTVTSTLSGKYVRVQDTCGSISLSATAPADINFGTSSGTDCTTPGSGGSGNTHASRTGYYHLTLWKEKAMSWLPSNSWLQGQLTDKVNLNQTCNAYWDGSAVNFFKSGGGCSNTGELPTVFLHEVGHGLDSNDGSPSSTVGSSESYSDINAVLMTHSSCMGVNFFTDGSKCSGYGNPCTTCTGIRDADYAKHTYSTSPAVPTQLTGTTGYHCSASSSYPGPCGREGHCESYIMSEVGWDIAARDLPSAGYDSDTSWYIADRLFFLTRPTSGDAYACPSVSTANGCGSSNWYETYLAADDDNGNLSDGTPHAAAIYGAFNRHAIACTTGSHTSYSACGTIGRPTLTATAGSGSVSLSWPAVSGATKYKVLRNELGATAGMTIMATPTTNSYTDNVVAIGITYYYSVVAIGSSDACFGALSAVQSATPTAGATYSISGTVSGATASGVTMSLTGAATASTTTDSSGNYSFAGLSNGSYTVTPSKSGYTFSPTSIAVTVSGASQTGKNFTATAVPTYSIAGTVSGDTASGVTMTLTGAATASTTTASDGTYAFSGLMNGSYTVAPSKSGYTFSPTSIAVTISNANQTGKNFTATAAACGGALTAAYSSTYGCPAVTTMAGTSVTAPSSLLQCRGTTGESNAPNTIDGCADGNSGSCHSDESIESITVASTDGSSCMAPGVQVTATVSTYCYNTADYITFFYSTSASSPSWTKVGSTQQAPGSGTRTFTWTFTLGGTAGAAQAVRAQMVYNSDPGSTACLSGNYNDRDDLVFLTAGSTPATYSISGTVSGATASGVTMSLTGASTATTTTDTSGNYTFSGLANGSYTVTPSKSGYAFSPTSIAVTISGANQTGKNFTATSTATYSISGTVSGATASGVSMSLTGASTATTTTDTSGNYTFSGLSNGSYTVTPSKSGYIFSPTSIAVTISGANQTGKNFTSTATGGGCSALTATYNSTYHCPAVTETAMSVTAPSSLLSCRGTTGESNAPNTIDGCADGNSGSCHSDESIEAITVASSDGSSCMAVGQQVTVTVSTYCYSTADYITLFYSTTASGPSWTKVGSTQQAPGSGTRTFTWTFTLGGSAGSAQALRAQMTYNSDPGTAPCLSGSYNDRDDLVFLLSGTAPTTYSISGTVSGDTASGVSMSLTGASAASTTTDASGNYTFSGLANGSYTVTPSKSGYTFSPTSIAVTISGANQTGKNFTATASTGPTTLFSNGFESSTGWAQVDTSGTAGSWTRVTSGTYPTCQEHSGSYMAKFNSYSASSGSQTRYYRTSGFAVSSSYSTVTLTLWMYHDTGYSSSYDKVQPQVSTNGSTWVNVGSAINRVDGTTGWAQHSVDLSAYKGQTVYLGFLGISAYGNNEYIDDVTVIAQ